jgi:hypothetical protein
MLRRMRQPAVANPRVEWGGTTPIWSSGPGSSLFGGDTVIAFAGFGRAPSSAAIRLLADDADGRTIELARAEAESACPGDSLARLAAARRLTRDDKVDAELAVQYQLMTAQTNCILVHRRDEADKTSEQAELHRVTSMLAAGWGGVGAMIDTPRGSDLWPSARFAEIASTRDDVHFSLIDSAPKKVGAFRAGLWDETPATLWAVAQAARRHFAAGEPLQGLGASCDIMQLPPQAMQALDGVMRLGPTLDEAALLLVHWINTRVGGLANVELGTLIRPLIDAVDPELVMISTTVFEDQLGGYPIDSWTADRALRLRHALGRTGS